MMSRIPNIHDRFFHETFTRIDIARSFLQTYLPVELSRKIDLESIEIVKDSFIDNELKEHFSDILYSVKYGKTRLYIYLLFEHKSYPEPLVALQLLRYMVKIWDQNLKQNPRVKKLSPIVPLVFYHGRTRWRVAESFQDIVDVDEYPELERYVPAYRYLPYDISHLPDEEIRGEVVGRIVLLISKYIFKPELSRRLHDILEIFHLISDKETAIEILEVILRYVVQTTGKFDEADFRKMIEKTNIGENIMQTFIDKYIEQGIQQGVQQGIQQGVQQGLQKGTVKILLLQMESRFGKLPDWVKNKVYKADLASIENWGIRLLNAKTIDEIFNDHD